MLAVVFAGLLQGMMLTSFVWPAAATPAIRAIGWLTAGCVWLVAVVVSSRNWPQWADRGDDESADALFRDAQTEYLKGNWYQAQVLLEQLLQLNRHDVDAALMLASLDRHVGRIGQARERLRRLQRFDASSKWGLEIRRELEYLDRLACEQDQTTAAPPPTAAASEAA